MITPKYKVGAAVYVRHMNYIFCARVDAVRTLETAEYTHITYQLQGNRLKGVHFMEHEVFEFSMDVFRFLDENIQYEFNQEDEKWLLRNSNTSEG